jgi:uncharacterized membrane protein YbhN (UPF0104 family)
VGPVFGIHREERHHARLSVASQERDDPRRRAGVASPLGETKPRTRRYLRFTARMAWRERLLRRGAAAAAIATDKRVRRSAQLLLALGLLFVALRLRTIWRDSNLELGGVHWVWLAGAVATAAASVAASGAIWLVILRELGIRARLHWMGIFLQSQLTKYIPGSVWQYAGRATLARAYGVPLRVAGKSMSLEVVAAVVAAVVFITLLLGSWALPVVLVALVASALATRNETRAGVRAVGRATALYGFVWALMSVSFWMTSRAFVGASATDLAKYAGAFACAWVVGFFAIYAPGGLGVREAMLVLLLRGRLGAADALVVAAGSRAVFTIIDCTAAAIGVGLLRLKRNASTDDGLPTDVHTAR